MISLTPRRRISREDEGAIAMPDAKVVTRHPLGKTNKPVGKENYELFKQAIVSALKSRDLTHTELVAHVEKSIRDKSSGSVSWHVMTVKLDLEARNIIERTSSKPQRYRLK
jgi:hypothetical protein